jgi:hypothetical protein
MEPHGSLLYSQEPFLGSVLRQLNPVHTFPHSVFKIHLILSSRLRIGLRSGVIRSGFPMKIVFPFLMFICLLHARQFII